MTLISTSPQVKRKQDERRNASPVWQFFNFIDGEYHCNVKNCKNVYAKRATAQLQYHLTRAQPELSEKSKVLDDDDGDINDSAQVSSKAVLFSIRLSNILIKIIS